MARLAGNDSGLERKSRKGKIPYKVEKFVTGTFVLKIKGQIIEISFRCPFKIFNAENALQTA